MKHCFYRLTAPYNMRIVQVMEAEHRYQQGFYALARIARTRCAVWRLFFKVSLYGSMGKLPVLSPLTQLGRKAYVCYLKPLGVFTR